MALIKQVGSVRVAEVKLIIEVNAARHDVLRERVGGLEGEPAPEPPLSLHKQRIVVVDAWGDERVDLAETRTYPPLGEKTGIEIRKHNRAAGVSRDIRCGSHWRVEIEVVRAGGKQVHPVRPRRSDG